MAVAAAEGAVWESTRVSCARARASDGGARPREKQSRAACDSKAER